MTLPIRRVPFGSFVLSTLIVTPSLGVVVMVMSFHSPPWSISWVGFVTVTLKSESVLGSIS